VIRGASAAGLLLATYLAGVTTGVVGSQQPASARGGGVLDQAADRINHEAANPVSRAELDRAAIQGMLGALGDRWSAYYDTQQFASFEGALGGRYTGVGLWLHRESDGVVSVTSVQAHSAAARAGVVRGDELIAVAGRSVAGTSVADLVAALRGPAGSSVAVVLRHGRVPEHVLLVRSALVTGDVVVDTVAPGITRIKVLAFTRGVGRETEAAVAHARRQGATGIVLDLRDNPGGLLDEAVQIASVFLDGGPVVSYVRRGETPRRIDASGHGDMTTPLAVLVNGGTASAAEVVAGALQDRNRAVVIGTQTFGKGTVQEPSRLADGSGLELTVGHYVTPSGRSLNGVGIQPDIEVTAGPSAGDAVDRAVDVLRGLVADRGSSGRG
jgi:carboxyl-terminal processing protease